MITFQHTTDTENANVTVFEAVEDGKLLGKCLLKRSDNTAEIFALSHLENHSYIVEGLVKSALNFASFKGAYIGIFSARGYDKALIEMGFEFVNGVYKNDIPTILMGKCCGQ